MGSWTISEAGAEVLLTDGIVSDTYIRLRRIFEDGNSDSGDLAIPFDMAIGAIRSAVAAMEASCSPRPGATVGTVQSSGFDVPGF